MIKAILFDFDDTLIEYSGIAYWMHCQAAKKLCIDEPEEKVFFGLLGTTWDHTIRTLWPDYHDYEHLKKTVLEFANQKERKQIEGSSDTITHLKEKGILVGVLTSRERPSLLSFLSQIGLPQEMWDMIYGLEDSAYHKPDGKVFDKPIMFLERRGIAKDEVMYIGDSPNDALAAKGAGIRFLGVCTGQLNKDGFKEMGFLSTKSVKEIPKLLDLEEKE